MNFITHGVSKSEDEKEGADDEFPTSTGASEGADEEESPLDKYATNLNEEAIQGQIDPLIGRLDEVERVAQILARRRKNNPLLVGESGVGKRLLPKGWRSSSSMGRCQIP